MHDEGVQSSAKIFANIFISFVGAGVLGLPYAFKEVGPFRGNVSSFNAPGIVYALGWSYGGSTYHGLCGSSKVSPLLRHRAVLLPIVNCKIVATMR